VTGDHTGQSTMTQIVGDHGTHTVGVTVSASRLLGGPEVASTSLLVTVGNRTPPTPSVSADHPVVLVGSPIIFTASSVDPDGDPVTYNWNFGNGNTASSTGPTIQRTLPPGPATVSVTAQDAFGAPSPAAPIDVLVNQSPRAKLTLSQNPIGVGRELTLSSAGSSDPEGGPLTFAWDLGLGTLGQFGNAASTTVTFTTPGAKTLRLDVMDPYGATNEDTASVTVTPRQPPAPDFVFFPTRPQTGQAVNFVSTTTTNAGESPIAALAWDLDGDGNFSDSKDANVSATFQTAGPHTVSLRATDTDGVSAIAQKVVNVTAAPGTAPGTATGPGTVTDIGPVNTANTANSGNSTGSGGTKAKSARLMSPFPKVRIRGVFFKTSVKLSFISVTARAGSTVKLKCAGHGCPKQKTETKKVPKGKRSVRFTKFPNALRKGATLRVYITRKGVIGKYTRFRIRVNKAPARLDACLPASGSTRPRKCPLPK
jgi:PKD repeat protein